jgi:hypothetical protein
MPKYSRFNLKPINLLTALTYGFTALLLSNCGIPTNGQTNPSQQNKAMTFKLEDYKAASEAQKKLSELFPAGTDNEVLVNFMEKIGVECAVEENTVKCYALIPNPEKTQANPEKTQSYEWLVTTTGANNKISAIEVQSWEVPRTKFDTARVRGFRFEDYETAESALAKLTQLFPAGSQPKDFLAFMQELKVDCTGPFKNPEGKMLIDCEYQVPQSYWTAWSWSVYAELDADGKQISQIRAYRDYASP